MARGAPVVMWLWGCRPRTAAVVQERGISCFFFSTKDGLRSSVAGFGWPTAVDTQPTEVCA